MVASWSISEEKYPQKNQGTAGLEPATFSYVLFLGFKTCRRAHFFLSISNCILKTSAKVLCFVESFKMTTSLHLNRVARWCVVKPKIQFGEIRKGLAMEDVGIFY
jgi:hypothetical protein